MPRKNDLRLRNTVRLNYALTRKQLELFHKGNTAHNPLARKKLANSLRQIPRGGRVFTQERRAALMRFFSVLPEARQQELLERIFLTNASTLAKRVVVAAGIPGNNTEGREEVVGALVKSELCAWFRHLEENPEKKAGYGKEMWLWMWAAKKAAKGYARNKGGVDRAIEDFRQDMVVVHNELNEIAEAITD